MAPKRKNNETEEPSSHDKKKLKLATARTIQVQTTTTAVPLHQNALSGPSRPVIPDSMNRLPSAIDVEKFAEARAFEIDAMQKAIKSASGSATQRAWQALPRHLRRRAASHDVRRVPLRLREKARAEMDPIRKKSSGRSPKLGKDKQISRAESLLRRQRDKLWLETHIWHAKRMKMENMWGYRLAVHPTEKAFRSSYRAAVHGSILHDASYHSLIELKGPESILRSLLELCCDPQGNSPGSKRYLTGSRIFETHLYKPGSYPFDLVAPITILWKTISSTQDACPLNESSNNREVNQLSKPLDESRSTRDKKRNSGGKGTGSENSNGTSKGKEKEVADKILPQQTDSYMSRIVWIRSHPAAFGDAFAALQTSASLALDIARRLSESNQHPGDALDIELADMRGQVNVFEIMGPKSSQVIKGALTPVADDEREEFKQFWSSLANLQSTGSLPRGMVIGCKVHDPRLKFPPKNAKPKFEQRTTLSSTTISPAGTLAQCDIWNADKRDKLRKPRYRKKDLDERRSKNLIPGSSLRPLRQDDRVPVLLIQRSLESTSTRSGERALHGWTLIVPAGWSMPFFSSLIYTGTRVGGLRERQTQSFEAGVAYFPRDYPSTTANAAEAAARAMEEKARWERKPPAKRPNFDKLGTRSPWVPDWEVVLGLESASEGEKGGDYVTTQREDLAPQGGRGDGEEKVRPWLLRGPDINAITASSFDLFNPGAGLWSEVNKLRMKRGHDPLGGGVKAEGLWKGALVTVKLLMCGRGAPDDLAAVYCLHDDELKKWNRILEHRKSHGGGGGYQTLDEEASDETELASVRPPQDSIIGYVTTGNFSLSRGEGFSIGAIPLFRLHELSQQAKRLETMGVIDATSLHSLRLLVKVRDREGHKCRAAHIELLDG